MTHLKISWCWQRLRARGEGDERGWDGWIASLTQWTWIWVDSRSWWLTGRPSVLWFMRSQKVGHNWAELNYDFINISETFCHLCFTDILFVLYYCLYYKYYDYSNIHSFPSFSYYCLLKNLQFLSPNHNYLDHFILEPRLAFSEIHLCNYHSFSTHTLSIFSH